MAALVRDWALALALLLVLLPGFVAAVHYNHSLALRLVHYASAVYTSDITSLSSWTCSRCHGLIKDFEVANVIRDDLHKLQAVVGVDPELSAVVVMFRGTRETSFLNWISDLSFLQERLGYPGSGDAQVHHGFFNAYHRSLLRPEILSAVSGQLARRPFLRVLVTGHSLGAALACLCALDLTVNARVKGLRIVTFGQPRVGNAEFARFFNSKVPSSIRMTHDHDIVPHLPPLVLDKSSVVCYHHVATEVWLYRVGKYELEQVCNGSGEDLYCSLSVPGDSILDHRVYLGVPLHSTLNLQEEGGAEVEAAVPEWARKAMAAERALLATEKAPVAGEEGEHGRDTCPQPWVQLRGSDKSVSE